MTTRRAPTLPHPVGLRPDESVGQIWAWCSIPTFLFSLALWIRTTTNSFKLVDIAVESQELAPILGLMAAPIVLLSIWLASRYAKQTSGLSLPLRVPTPLERWPRGEI